jgi:hypothetical protein
MQISKNLQTHCHAIQSAIKKYNDAASKLQPPAYHLNGRRFRTISSLMSSCFCMRLVRISMGQTGYL